MKKMKNLLTKHALLLYFVLAFVISWGGILASIGLSGILGTQPIPEKVMPVVYLATLFGPSLAGILSIALVDGHAGFRSLWSRLKNWRVAVSWYLVALITAPLLICAVLAVLYRTSPVFLPALFASQDKVSLLLIGLVMGLAVAFFEELGWTGFAVPRLINRYGVFSAGLLLGILWGLWHMPLFLASVHSSGPIPPVIYLLVLLFSFLPPYRILMVSLYHRTGSLLVTILMHAPLTASQLVLIPAGISGRQLVTFDLALGAVLWVLVVLTGVIKNKKSKN